jgi:serine/threonine protein kinase
VNSADYIGQTLDQKYRIESELGRGGMGSVYLATHLGTERPVAVKIIAPQFMRRPEFVERFRREARAAGRLRHPNVVDVTDFGFADTEDGRVAYLVMEYLDGCTLGEILEEEKNLPVGWSLDILEQVCSAVNEAHSEGIIHRDLKPDNIWLEPNQRGGYTVKVLDFGIAKLEEQMARSPNGDRFEGDGRGPARETLIDITFEPTISDVTPSPTVVSDASTVALVPGAAISEAGTLIQTVGSEEQTAIFGEAAEPADGSARATKVDSLGLFAGTGSRGGKTTSTDLTKVGSVLGTPLYMSPEQCGGEKLDARSDIYSLGVIAYQMISGRTPFTGEFADVMEAHKYALPPPLEAKKVRRKLKKVVMSALAKDREARPQSAEAFASELRSQSEGIWMLLRRSLVIFSEQMPKFLGLTTLLSIPVIFLTATLIMVAFLRVSDSVSETTAKVLTGFAGVTWSIVIAFCAYLITGTTTWIVTQHLAVPLRPIKVREALREARKKWKAFAGTGLLSTFSTFVFGAAAGLAAVVVFGLISLALYQVGGSASLYIVLTGVLAAICSAGAFLVVSILWTLVAPVMMMENLTGWKALKRSQQLVKRSLLTTIAAVFIMFLIPALTSGLISFMVNTTTNSITKSAGAIQVTDSDPAASNDGKAERPENGGISFSVGRNQKISVTGPKDDVSSRLAATVSESLIQILWLPMHIFVTAFTAIIVALLFLKSRQAGGESMQELLSKFEDSEKPRKKWQERVRQRLIQSGRITSRSS